MTLAAGPPERQRDALADAGIGAGDQHGLAVEAECGEIDHRSASIGTFSTSV